MDREIYRSVPFRFAVSKSNADICKLEQLTNLFPEVKEFIELELFKFNNLMQMINRLSNIYSATSAVDTRDDTLHIFLGPYHLSLGPAVFGAMRFKNVSKAILASSQAKSSNGNSAQSKKRRHDAALRRFRRAVRKLIHIKSIVDKLRIASILTPYNQYQLYTDGIYDLVLAGHKHLSDSVFIEEDFLEQIQDLKSTNEVDHKNPLVASQYIKINTLLQLLSPSSQQQQPENNPTPGQVPSVGSEETKSRTTNEHSSQSLLTSANICCSHHFQNARHMMFPLQRSISHQPAPFFTLESQSRRNSRMESRRNSSALPRPTLNNNIPNSKSEENIFATKSNNVQQSQMLVPIRTQMSTQQEDALVDRISALLTNHLLMHANDNPMKSKTNSPIETTNFDELLQRIRTEVDHNLIHQSNNHPHKHSIRSIDASHSETLQAKSILKKRRMHLQFKSQSADSATLDFSPTIPELNDVTIEF